ncbi:MAG: DUF4357 domain-containing protein [Lachnospiraceae bacterium]|nr:DUF4357 domain-containing protein [Lachnospiraceae bacterium]
MKVNIYLIQKKGRYSAKGVYEDGMTTVFKGGRIQLFFSEHIKGGQAEKIIRNNPEYVDSQGNILKDCVFKSASAAAQFVTGYSTNGLLAWKVDKKVCLKDYLTKEGL